MNIRIRKSTPADLPFLQHLETLSFPEFQRSSVRSLQRAVNSTFQEVYIAETDTLTTPVTGKIVPAPQGLQEARESEPEPVRQPGQETDATRQPGQETESVRQPGQETDTPQPDHQTDAGTAPQPAGAAIIFRYPKSLRLYSIAVAPEFRKAGIGNTLLHFITNKARTEGYASLTAEAHASNTALIYLVHESRISGYDHPAQLLCPG